MKKRIKCLMLCLVLGFSFVSLLIVADYVKKDIQKLCLRMSQDVKQNVMNKKVPDFINKLEKTDIRISKIITSEQMIRLKDLKLKEFMKKIREADAEIKDFRKCWINYSELKINQKINKINQILFQLEEIVKNKDSYRAPWNR